MSRSSSGCFVPHCNSGYRTCKEKRSLFMAPKEDDRRKVWEGLIRRKDVRLKPSHKVCELHFEEHFIVKSWKHVIDGVVVEIPRDYPTLSNDAVPTKFPGYPKYYSNVKLPKKRPATDRTLANIANKRMKVCIIISLLN